MRPRTLRTAIAVVTAGITLTACGSDDGGDGGGGGDGADAAAATSAEDFGGMDALVEAAQEEGELNVIALPPDWANYGEMLDTFSEKYGIEINSASPDGSSQDELNAVESQRGQGSLQLRRIVEVERDARRRCDERDGRARASGVDRPRVDQPRVPGRPALVPPSRQPAALAHLGAGERLERLVVGEREPERLHAGGAQCSRTSCVTSRRSRRSSSADGLPQYQ